MVRALHGKSTASTTGFNSVGKILNIFIAHSGGSIMQNIETADLHASKGIRGDRYFSEHGYHTKKNGRLVSKAITLIESEEIDHFNRTHGFNFHYADFRRNIITQGIRLNQFEGEDFMLGDIRLRGVELCEPCAHLANLLAPEALSKMVHRAGLRAHVIDSGRVTCGQTVSGLAG